MKKLLLSILLLVWVTSAFGSYDGILLKKRKLASTPTGWIETFDQTSTLDKTWYAMSADHDYTTGCYSGQCMELSTDEVARTTDFTPTNTLVVSVAGKPTLSTSTNNIILIYDSNSVFIAGLRMKSSNNFDIIENGLFTDVGDLSVDGTTGYFSDNAQYFIKLKVVQSATAGEDQIYAYMSSDGTTWNQGTSLITRTFTGTGTLSKVYLEGRTGCTWIADSVKITTDGSDTSDY